MACFKLICVVLACMLMAAPMMTTTVEAAVVCGTVTRTLGPCMNFLRSGGAVPAACCSGVGSVRNNARTTADRQQTCECLKQAAGRISGIKPDNAANLPKLCNVNIPYTISTSTNCKTVK